MDMEVQEPTPTWTPTPEWAWSLEDEPVKARIVRDLDGSGDNHHRVLIHHLKQNEVRQLTEQHSDESFMDFRNRAHRELNNLTWDEIYK